VAEVLGEGVVAEVDLAAGLDVDVSTSTTRS